MITTSTATAATMPTDRVIDRLERGGWDPKPTGPRSWRSRCPAHEGDSLCLSISEGDDGRVLLHCNAHACKAKDIAQALNLAVTDLFVTANRLPSPRRPKPAKNGNGKVYRSPEAAIASTVKQFGQPVACWIYHEPGPHELMRVYRFDQDGKKQFRPVHPDASGWHLGDPPGKLPLYHLDELAAADTIVVAEGEKCADLVKGLGLTATTSAHGSQAPRKTDWSPLAGKSIVILPDHDDAGEKYAQVAAEVLSALDPRPDVRILRLPGLEDGGDIEQWLESHPSWDPAQCRRELALLWDKEPPLAPPPVVVPAPPADRGEPKHRTELGNAERLVAAHGHRLRYCRPLGKWFAWDDHRWAMDDTGVVERAAKETVRAIYREAADIVDDQQRRAMAQWAMKSEQRSVIKNMIDLASTEPGIAILPEELDRDPYALNCPNGTVDLRTGRLQPHRQQDLISKCTAVPCDLQADCPLWRETLATIFDRDDELIAYVQRALGYSLSGDIGEHAMFLCFGTGRNGKNTVLDTVRTLLSDYATVVNPRLLLSAGSNDHPAMIADLLGRRFVPTSEIEEGERLAESLVKRLTGDKTVKARFMRGNPFEFPLLCKLWMLANCKPEIHGQDEGIWSRIRLIPFEVFIPPENQIKNLSERLIQDEGPAILGWLVRGCLEWQQHGLGEPAKVIEALRSYRSEQDVVGDFIGQCCESFLENPSLRDSVRVKAADLYMRYATWCKDNGEKTALTNRRFGSEMTRRGYPLRPSNACQFRYGLMLRETRDSGSDDSDGEKSAF
jgi:putative DNA primase/helicase